MARNIEEIKRRMVKTKFVEEDTQSEVRPGYERLDDIKRRVNRDSYHKSQSERINSILQGAQNYFNGFQNKLDGMTWENASQVNDQITADSTRMLSEYNEVRNYLDTHGDRLDKDTYAALEEALQAMESARVHAQSFATDRKNYFSSFDSEEAYIRGAAENSAQRQQRYEDNLKRIEELKTERAIAAPASTYNTPGRTEYGEEAAVPATTYNAPGWGEYGKVKQIDDEIRALEAENRKYERGEDGFISKTVDDYGEIAQRDDFAIGSASRDYTNASREDLWNYDVSVMQGSEALSAGGSFDEEGNIRDSDGNIVQTAAAPIVEDKLGLFLSVNEDEVTEAYNLLSTGNGNYTNTWANLLKEGDQGSWKYLSEQEIGIYYYLLESSQEDAYKYLSDMKTELNRRKTLDESGQWYEAYDDANLLGKILLNAATVPAKFVSNAAGFVEDAYNTVTGNEINPYSAAHGGMHFSQTVRGATAENLDATGFKIPVLDFTLGDIYQTGMSRIDSALATRIFGGGGTIFLGMGAAEEEAYKLYKQGASAEQITLGALSAGAAEAVWEYVSYGKLKEIKNVDSPSTWVKSVLVQGWNEATEEAATEVSNILTNALIMGSQSDLAELYQENEEAAFETFVDLVKQTAHSAFGGFLGGVGAGAMQSTGVYIDATSKYRNVGGVILDTEGGLERLTTLAKELDGISAYGLGKQAEAVSKKATAKNVGKLVTDINSTINGQNSKDLSARLVKAGFDVEMARQIADAVITLRSDYKGLTTEQASLLGEVQSDERVLTAIGEVLDTEGSAAYQRSAQLRAVLSAVASAADGEQVAGVNGENADPLTQLARETVETQYAQEDGAGLDGISAEGRAIYGEQAVDVADIDQAGGGKVTVKLADGRSVDATALEYEDAGEAELWRVIGKYAEDADSARALLEEYRLGDLDAYTYARGIEEAFLFGKVGISAKEMEQTGSYANMLNITQRNMAYKQGRIAGQKKVQQRQDELVTNKKGVATPAEQARNDKGSGKKSKKGQLHFEGDRGKLTARQKVSLQACEVVAKALGIQVYVFESEKVGNTRVGENGWYDPKDGSIHIDLHAGQNGEGVMVFTLAHELTHFIRDWSPAKFRTLSGFLAEQYAKKGQSVAELVHDQQRRAKEDGRELSFEEAHEEWVADSMEQMLSDGTIMEKLAMLQAKDMSLVEKIKTFLKDFVERLKAAYKDLRPQSAEGQIVSEMVDAAQELQDLFADALLDAGENFRTAEKNTTGEGGVNEQAVRRSARIVDQIQTNLAAIMELDSVYTINSSNATPYEGIHKNDETSGRAVFKAQGNAAIRPGFGRVVLGRKGVVNTVFHGNGPAKQAAFPAIKAVIEKGIKIGEDKNHKGKGYDTVTFGAPVDFFGAKSPLGVVVQVFVNGRGDKSFYIHEICDAEGNYIELVNGVPTKKEISSTGLVDSSSTAGTAEDGIAPKDSIRNFDGIVKENDSMEKRTSSRSGTVSDREMLVDLFEQMVTGSDEYRALQNYKKNIDQMLALEEKVDRLSEEIKRVSFAEGPRNMEYLDNLKQQRKKAVAELDRYDNILLGLEKSGVLRSMIERNREVIRQETKDKVREYYRQKNETREAEIRQYYRESRRQAVERHDKAQVRQRIRKDVQRLDSLLNKGTKEKNVKLELQDFAGAALRTAKGAFLKNYNEYDMVRGGVDVTLSREQKAVFARAQELLKELDQIRDQKSLEPAPDNMHERWDPEAALRRDDHEEALKKELAKNMAVLREAGIFRLENERIEDSVSDKLMEELMAAYSALKDSESAHVREVFSSTIYDHIDRVREDLKGRAIKDMNAEELADLHKLYRLVLHTITTSNDLFAQKRKADVRKLGEEVIGQLQTPGKEKTAEILDKLAKMGWANLKPETALEIIGSDTLIEMMQGLYRGEDTYARDLEHARQYAEEQGMKYGYKDWDLKKSVSFAGTKITLGQAMSLYAYTKRKQAQGHLEREGFTHSSNVRIKEPVGNTKVELTYIMNATKTHIVPKTAYADVEKLLTAEQRKYVDAMQEYLSKVMGAKGNEVSMQLYGVKLFEETMYFPLKTASEYREQPLGATTGEVKLKNSGFTKKVEEKARNPIVLDSFEDVWAAHVDKMSLYHGFVLPMEDFDRVYNYRHAQEEAVSNAYGEVVGTKLVDTNESVKVDIENKMGKVANEYIENFMKQLNGGVRGDSTEKLFSGMARNFKKTAVLGSLSVAVQQPTAFIRAMAYLDIRDIGNPKDFLGKAGKPEGKILEEMYKYAPVALMKRIGGFDPGLGRTTREYVFADKQGVTGALDKFLGKFPEKMDEWTWSYIWICTKRQIHRQNPDLKINSEAFLEKVGERFSKIIRDTQVYDSVLTKSQIMRSKNVFLQMATAFMNEPTTSLDMYIRSTIQAKRGKIKKGQAARTYAAVVGSQILTSAVVAFVYAMRDDDEDETYWEKYMSAFIGKTWENTMPWYSIPFVKDAFSVFDGYSVERSDMSLIVDLYQGWQKLQSDKATPWEKTEAFAGSILNVFGIPLKNVSRDVRGIFNTVSTWFNGGVEKTSAGLRYAILEGLTGKQVAKSVQLQNAVVENDAKHILRVMATYSTEDAAITAIRSVVKELFMAGKVTEEAAMEFLQVYAGHDAAEAEEYLIKWNFAIENPNSGLDPARVPKYIEYAEPAGISAEVYAEYCDKKAGYSKREDILRVINALPISKNQKDALYFAEGYAESTLDEAPWH